MYDRTARWLHWGVAALYIAILLTGLTFDDLADGSPEKRRMLDLHTTGGLLLLGFAAWRLARRRRDGMPEANPAHRPSERKAARGVRAVLLAATVVLPLTGLYELWAVGDPLIVAGITVWPGGATPAEAGVPRLLAFALHGGPLIVLGLTPFLALHVAGALKHHFWDRDDTLRRMWSGPRTAA